MNANKNYEPLGLIYGLWWNYNENRVMFSVFPETHHIKSIAEKFGFNVQDLYNTLVNEYDALIRKHDGCLYWKDDEKAYQALQLIEGMVMADRLRGKKVR